MEPFLAPKIQSEDDGQQPKLPKLYILNLPSPCPQVEIYLENLGDVGNDASLTRGVTCVRDAAQPDEKRQGSTVSACFSCFCPMCRPPVKLPVIC